MTRNQILRRAHTWVADKVPYSTSRHWRDGYRQDCSGFVSMAWGLGNNQWTGSLPRYAERISASELQPGDLLLFHNPQDPYKGSHAVVFGGWTDASHHEYLALEETKPHARVRRTPYPYWSHRSRYVPYRYKYVRDGDSRRSWDAGMPDRHGPHEFGALVDRLGGLLPAHGTSAGRHRDRPPAPPHRAARPARPEQPPPAAQPQAGPARFRPGQSSDDVTALGRQLVAKGFGGAYRVGPDPVWREADRPAVEAFQRAQGWSGREADGYPGPETWKRLFS